MLPSEEATGDQITKTGLLYRVFVPGDVGADSPLVVLVHGRTGDASAMWTFTRTFEAFRPLTVAPQAPLEDPEKGFCWWVGKRDGARKTELRELLDASDLLREFIFQVCGEYSIDGRNIIGIGFSQGGALLSALSLLQPSLFKGVAVLSAFLPAVVFTSPEFETDDIDAAQLPSYFIAHGKNDEVVPVSRAHAVRDLLQKRGADVTFVEDETTHKLSSQGLQALSDWCGRMLQRAAKS